MTRMPDMNVPSMRRWRWLLLLLALAASAAFALVPVPPFTGYVIDRTGTLTAEQARALDEKLTAFTRQKGSQIAVLMVPGTAPESIEQYSIRVAEQWKLGRKGVDDGALLLVAKNDRTLRIEVGYGLEGVLPDAINKRIIAEIITPYFQKGDFAGGINAGVDQMIRLINGEPLPPRQTQAQGSEDVSLIAILVGALFVGHILTRILGRLAGATLGGVGAGLVAATVVGGLVAIGIGVLSFLAILLGIWFFPGMGGGGGGNDRGGGFRGGGGGTFGGGGASGRW